MTIIKNGIVWICLILGMLGTVVHADFCELVKDINSGSVTSSPTQSINVNGTLFFRADNGINGAELWKSDGTAIGTVMLKDINPGSSSSRGTPLINMNGTLFFRADDGINGSELWKSDGTSAGTVMVKDITSGSGSSNLYELININNILFFVVDDGVIGRTIWKSDGTEAGTVMIKNINADSLTNINGTLFFTVWDSFKNELWKSDGTEAGTVMVKGFDGLFNDLYEIANLTNLNDYLCFTIHIHHTRSELWKSDGTTSGTVMVKKTEEGTEEGMSLIPSFLVNVNNFLFWGCSSAAQKTQLWKSNGSTSGTILVKERDILDTSEGFEEYGINLAGTLFFVSEDNELWKSDGTNVGTVMVKDINSQISDVTSVNGILYFSANGKIWKSDGTTAGTIIVNDIDSNMQAWFTNVNNSLFYNFDDGVLGDELWKNEQSYITSVSPTYGALSGGNIVTISGMNLGNGSDIISVKLNGITAAIQSQSATQIVVLAGNSTVSGTGSVIVSSSKYGDTIAGETYIYSDVPIFTLTYLAGTNGLISGATLQHVASSIDGTLVIATPDEGFHFVDWSDGSTANPRTDTNMTGDLTVTANFFMNASLWTCGDNSAGQLGDGTTIHRSTPVQIYSSDVQSVAAGSGHTLIVKSDGSLWGCGGNNYGQLGNGTGVSTSTPLKIYSSGVKAASCFEFSSLILKTDGSVWEAGAGNMTFTQIYPSGVKSISNGAYHCLMLKTDGSLWGKGDNSDGELGDGTRDEHLTPVQIYAGGVQDMVAGGIYSLILKTDGSLWACGNNDMGQLGDGTTTTRLTPVQIFSNGVKSIGAGYYHSLIVKTDGSLWVFGDNNYGQLGDGTIINRSTPVQMYSSGVQNVSAGQYHTLILKTDGSLLVCGLNDRGQLGDGTTLDRLVPVPICSSGVIGIASGDCGSRILKFPSESYTLTYNAGANGSIIGTTPQTVDHGANGVAVTATPNTGHHFVDWSDGSTGNPRTDTNVTGDITVTANFAENNSAEDLVAYYPFNGNANDESGNGNDGTVNGAILTTDRFGNANSAYNFDGVNDYFELTPHIANFSSLNTGSLSTWFKTDSAGCIVICAVSDKNDASSEARLILENGNIWFESRDDGTIKYKIISPLTYNDSKWHHVVVTSSPTETKLYIDGKLIVIDPRGGFLAAVSNADNMNIGRNVDNGGPQWYMDGSIDDMRIYNRVLIESEIKELYGVTIFVKHDATGNNNGNSWNNAYTDLQDALTFATSGKEIWVAAGMYKPTSGTDRDISFQMKDGVNIYGGFAGTETSKDQRDWKQNETILSGDIGVIGNAADNTYRVVYSGGDVFSMTLDGFTIKKGYCSAGYGGSGMLLNGTSVIIQNCHITQNYTNAIFGGAVRATQGTIASFKSCIFSFNTGDKGAAVYNGFGGASNNLDFINCIFHNNNAVISGGGIYTYASETSIINCVFYNNTNGGAGHGRGICNVENAIAIVKNSIFRDGGFEEIYNVSGAVTTSTYSNIQGGYSGTGNIDTDPLFVDVANSDFHLQSQARHYSSLGWITDGLTSPCIDVGDSSDIFANEPEPNGGRINMGVYGNTAEASRSWNDPAGVLVLISPDGGETLYRGVFYDITWISNNISGNIKIELFKNGVLDIVIATDTVNDGTYSWSVPSARTLGNDYKIKISSIGTPSIMNSSNRDFIINDYTLRYTAGINGSITGASLQTVMSGSDGTAVTAIPDTGYHFLNWSDGATDNPRTDTNVTADIAVTANFAINAYLLTYNAGANGSIIGVSPQTVNYASNGSAVTAVAVTGYHFVNWSDTSTANPRTDTNVTGNKTVIANFSVNPNYTLIVTSGTGDGSVVEGLNVSITADTPPANHHFDKWTTSNGGSFANANSATTDYTMPGNDATVTANFAENTLTVTLGSILQVDASEIANMDNEFTRKPIIYGKYTDPVNARDLKATIRGITRIAATAQNNKFECEWSRGIYLYDKRARLAANKLSKSTSQWISELSSGKIDDLQINLWAKATNAARLKIDAGFRGILMTPPVITEITGWDGGVFSGLHTKSVITIKGNYFGNKAPLVSLEYIDPLKGILIKQQRLKVLRPYKYSDFRDRIEKSCMDLGLVTGESEIRVEMPSRWWRDWQAGSYDLVLDNKIGLATYTVSTIASSVSNPVANNDTVTLIHGDSSYYIDVLANDTDSDADKMTIIPEEDKTTQLGGRIAVSKGKIRYTPPRGVLPNAFPDEFTYTLSDIHGGVSAVASTVTINMNAIILDPVKHWDGTALTIGSRTIQPSSRIILSGSNFGVRVPTVTMAVENDKILKLKVVSKAQYVDSKGKVKKSYTDLSTGESEITVELPKRAWVGYENSKVYTITVSNKFDTKGVGQSVKTSAENTTPTANPDSVDICSGEKCYYIDVLGNNSSSTSVVFSTNGVDTDVESDKLTIVLPLRKSNLGARLIVDRITNTIKYTRVKDELCDFTDSFEYSLMDASGAASETVTVNITGKLAP